MEVSAWRPLKALLSLWWLLDCLKGILGDVFVTLPQVFDVQKFTMYK
jgi:hypothetical protein